MSASVGRICAEGRLRRDFNHWQACIGEAVMPPVEYRIFIVQTAVKTASVFSCFKTKYPR